MSSVGIHPALADSPAEGVSAPDTTTTTSSSSATNGADMLTQSEWTRRLVAVACVVVVGLSILAIVSVMCYRVWIDGNSALTNDITTKLMWVALVGIGSMMAALFGSNSLIAKAIDKIIP